MLIDFLWRQYSNLISFIRPKKKNLIKKNSSLDQLTKVTWVDSKPSNHYYKLELSHVLCAM